MKKFFAFILAVAAICGVACTPNGGDNEGGNGGGNGNFTIKVTEISAESAYVSVTSANDKTFYFDIAEKAKFDEYADKIAYAEEYIAELKEFCDLFEIPLVEILSTGSDSFYYEDMLDPNSEYYAFAFNVDGNGVVSGAVEYVAFKTLEGSGDIGGGENVVIDNLVLANYEDYGDFYDSGATNWYIQMQDYSFENMVIVEVQTELNARSFVGTYEINDSLAAGSAVGGFIDEEGYLYGTFWGKLDDYGDISDIILTASGSITIAEATEGYTITIDAADTDGRTLKASYTGAVEPFPQGNTASRYSTAVRLNKRHALKVEPKSKIKRGAALVKAMAKR